MNLSSVTEAALLEAMQKAEEAILNASGTGGANSNTTATTTATLKAAEICLSRAASFWT